MCAGDEALQDGPPGWPDDEDHVVPLAEVAARAENSQKCETIFKI